MLTMNVCSSTIADGMVLLALSVAGLLCLLCICYAYACKWRYEYLALKSSVIVYNETKYDYMKSKRALRFGNDIIKENENYKHLGIIINNIYLSKKVNIKDVIDKLKGTYFYPHAFLKKGRGHCNRLRPSVCPLCYLLLNHWTKFNQIWYVSYSHEWGVQQQFFPAPWGPG